MKIKILDEIAFLLVQLSKNTRLQETGLSSVLVDGVLKMDFVVPLFSNDFTKQVLVLEQTAWNIQTSNLPNHSKKTEPQTTMLKTIYKWVLLSWTIFEQHHMIYLGNQNFKSSVVVQDGSGRGSKELPSLYSRLDCWLLLGKSWNKIIILKKE